MARDVQVFVEGLYFPPVLPLPLHTIISDPVQIVVCPLLADGARGSRIEEPLVFDLSYEIQWQESRVDLAELAKLRWIEGLSYQDLSLRYGRTRNAISNYCQNIRKKDFNLPGLTNAEKEKIKWEFQD